MRWMVLPNYDFPEISPPPRPPVKKKLKPFLKLGLPQAAQSTTKTLAIAMLHVQLPK